MRVVRRFWPSFVPLSALSGALVSASCSQAPDRPKTLDSEGGRKVEAPNVTTSPTTSPTTTGTTSATTTSTSPTSTSTTPTPAAATHRYAWCTGTLDPAKVYYAGRSIIYGNNHAIFDLTKPGEFCLATANYDVPMMRPNGKVVFQYGNKIYEWVPDDAVKPAGSTKWTEVDIPQFLKNDVVVPSPCPTISGGALGEGLAYDHQKNMFAHVCYQAPRTLEDGTEFDFKDGAGNEFFTKAVHSSGVRFGDSYPKSGSGGVAVRKSAAETVLVKGLPSTYSVKYVRVTSAGFRVVMEGPGPNNPASLWDVGTDGTATTLGDFADVPTGSASTFVIDANGVGYERVLGSTSDVIVRRPLKPDTVTVLFEKNAAANPAFNVSGAVPVMPLQYSGNGGLFTGL